MKRLLTTFLSSILLFCCSASLATIRYVATAGSSPAGNDLTNSGAINSPWLTLSHACSLSTSGDIIHVLAGDYPEPLTFVVPAGVSIEGEGDFPGGTHVLLNDPTGSGSTIYNSACITLISTSEGSAGNQTIQKIWFDGNNFTSFIGILVRARSNVTIDHCKFTNFKICAVNLNGKYPNNNTGFPPGTFSDGNKITNCYFSDCNDRIIQQVNSVSGGSITFAGQSNLLFQYDTTINTGKPQGHNGDCYAAIYGNNKGVRWLNCLSTKPLDEGASYNFSIESWYDQGGCEVAYCTFTGGGNQLDIGYGGANKGMTSKSWYIHDNIVTNSSLPTGVHYDSPYVPAGSFVTGKAYIIKSVGTTVFTSIGAGSNTVGIIFTALGPGSGSGTADPSHPVESSFVQFESSTSTLLSPLPPQNTNDGDAEISNNYLHNMGEFVHISLNNKSNDFIKNLNIHHNICDNMGYTNDTYSGVFDFNISKGALLDSIYIDNNTLIGKIGVGGPKAILIIAPTVGTMSNIFFRNNIAMNTMNGYGYLLFRGGSGATINKIYSQNNITYNDKLGSNYATFSPPVPPPTFTNFTGTGNITLEPLFVSSTDFHPASGSPAIDAGLIIGFPFNGLEPDIGALESGGTQENLLSSTEDLTNAVWHHNINISIIADDMMAPDCSVTADRVTTSNGIDNLYQTVSVSPNTTYTFSFFAKKGTIGTTNYNVMINSPSGASITTKVDYSALIYPDSWQRIFVTFTTDLSTTQIIVLPKNDGGTGGTLWIWGAQLNRGPTAAPYISKPGTTVIQENLLNYSEDLSNAVWHSLGLTFVQNDIADPNGIVTADKVTSGTGTDYLYQTVAVLPGTTYTFSFYAKKGTVGTTDYNVQVNSTSGASITTKVDYSGSLSTTVWNRISVSFTTDAYTTQIIVLPKNGATAGTLWIWGAQLNRGAAAAKYFKTLGTATVQQNLLKYSEDLSNTTVWTHNNMTVGSDAGITAPDGSTGASIITATTGLDNLYQTVPVSINTTYTFSFYAKKGTIGATDYNVQVTNTMGATLTTKVDYSTLINTTTWTRLSASFTTDGSTTQIIVLPKNDGHMGGTLWIWGAQLNKGATAACYIKTTTTPIGYSPPGSNIISAEQGSGIKVYPNPFNNLINININGNVADKLNLTLMSTEGKVVWHKNLITSSKSYNESINTSGFAKGIYFMRVMQNNISTVVKLVSQ